MSTSPSLEASRQSMVLLKNEPVEAAGASTTAVAAEPVLPLKPGQTVVALGYPANNSGNYLSNYHPGAPDPRFSNKPLPTAVTALACICSRVNKRVNAGLEWLRKRIGPAGTARIT